MSAPVTVTQADRALVADILDEVSNLLDHVGIGQAADLIRDGEYDEHDCVKIAARHRQSTEAASRAREAELVEAYHHHLSEVCAECYAGEGTDAFLAAMEFLSKRDRERSPDLFAARATATPEQGGEQS